METLTAAALGTKKKGVYRGLSLYNFEHTGRAIVQDVLCVKVDLLNHIYTPLGSRPMMPGFGTSIPLMLFELMNTGTIQTVVSEITRVINYDPRVKLLKNDDGTDAVSAQPNYQTKTLSITARIAYIELEYTDTLNLNIEFGAA